MWRAWRRAVGYPRWIGRPHMRRLMTGRSARRPAWRACGGDGCLPLYIPGAGWRSLSPGGRGLQVAGCEQRAWENECAKGNELGVLGVFYSRCRTVYRPPARFSQGSREKCCVERGVERSSARSAHPLHAHHLSASSAHPSMDHSKGTCKPVPAGLSKPILVAQGSDLSSGSEGRQLALR